MKELIRLMSVLGTTIIIEYPIIQLLWLAIKKDEESKLAIWKNQIVIFPVLIVNAITNPAINIFASFLLRNTEISESSFWTIITFLEFIVWAIEAVLYKYMINTRWSKAFALSISANFISYMASFLI